MKIGILTFHRADNMGAVLQAYALQNTIAKKCSGDCEIIDYRNSYIEKTKHPHMVKSPKGVVKYVLLAIYYSIKRIGFDSFRKSKLRLSGMTYERSNIEQAAKIYDLIIVGSDQVWNPACSGNDLTYFLDFCTPKQRYSYAASLGNYIFSDVDNEALNLIENYKRVSVREMSGVSELNRNRIKNVDIHSDPVFLLDENEWKSIMKKRLLREKYVFVYLIQDDVNVLSSAYAYAKKRGLKVISNKKSPIFILNNTPSDFLSWIYYAEAVFTNSFHGTAFSLIFNRKLAADIVLKNGESNKRILDLLNLVKARQCILDPSDIKPQNGNAHLSLQVEQNKGIEYLKDICLEG